MADLNILNAVFQVLTGDTTLLGYFGLTPSSTIAQKAARFKKEQEPEGLVTPQSIPLVLMYPQPGVYDPRNWMVYKGKFALDIFSSDLFKAMQIGARAKELLHDQRLPVQGTAAFNCYHVYETSFRTGISGVKGFRQWYDIDYIT